jgi:hypothetical protein
VTFFDRLWDKREKRSNIMHVSHKKEEKRQRSLRVAVSQEKTGFIKTLRVKPVKNVAEMWTTRHSKQSTCPWLVSFGKHLRGALRIFQVTMLSISLILMLTGTYLWVFFSLK